MMPIRMCHFLVITVSSASPALDYRLPIVIDRDPPNIQRLFPTRPRIVQALYATRGWTITKSITS